MVIWICGFTKIVVIKKCVKTKNISQMWEDNQFQQYWYTCEALSVTTITLIYGCASANPRCAEFISRNIKKHLCSVSFLNAEIVHKIGVIPRERLGPKYPTWSILLLLMTWATKESLHWKPYWLSSHSIFQFQTCFWRCQAITLIYVDLP